MTLALDCETALIRPGKHAPELVCGTWQRPGELPCIQSHLTMRPVFEGWLDKEGLLIGHNVAYDMGVFGAAYPDLVPGIFEAYDQDRVTDSMIRQKLLDIAAGQYRGKLGANDEWIKVSYHLKDIVQRWTGRYMNKDGWRMYYGEFLGVPLDRWVDHARSVQDKYRPDLARLIAEQHANPKAFDKKQVLADLRELCNSAPETCITYPLEDATGTLDGYLGQEKHKQFLEDQFRAVRKDWWLHLMSTWGLRTSPEGVARLKREAEAIYADIKGRLVLAGLVRKDGSRDTKAAKARIESVCLGEGVPLRKTAPTETNPDGGISLDEDACKATDDEVLHDYAAYTKIGTVLNKDVRALSLGIVYPIHTHFGMAETGRVTSANPNVQNWGKKGGARECFTPRPGFVYGNCDVDQLELRTLAEVCFQILGHSSLGDALNRGLDPHTAFACSADILDIPYEEGLRLKDTPSDPKYQEFDDARQGCKFTNFALPGGVGPAKMVVIARGAGIDLGKGQGEEASLAKARFLKSAWLRMWEEMPEYFAFINTLKNPLTGLYDLIQLTSNRYRGGARYPAACNSFFQGLGADATGRGGWYVARACYAEPKSPLFGCRPVNYSHDDLLVEIPDDGRAPEAAQEMSRLFVRGINELLPHVPATAKPLLTAVWTKKAKRLLDDNGVLKVWGPEHV